MNRSLLLVVLIACGGTNRPAGSHGATTSGDPGDAVGNLATAPPARRCEPASFVAFGGGTVEIFEIGTDCTARSASTIETELAVFDAVWPRHDQPVVLAVGEHEASSATRVLVLDQPLAAVDHRPAPRAVTAPGHGATEPEGYEFGLVTDGKATFVERCRAWDDGGGGGEESEEWDCTQHVYFAIDDKAGKKARAVTPAPRDVFTPVFAGGIVPGTGVELRLDAKAISCSLAGAKTTLDPWGAAYGAAVTPVSVIPLSTSEYLLGVDANGSRMLARKHVSYERKHGCEDAPAVGPVVPGPAGYWAERIAGSGSWRIHVGGDDRDVLDAKGEPGVFAVTGLAWTQP